MAPSGKREPGRRGGVASWSAGSARRNTAFLRSIDPDGLDGDGIALTLTLGETPATAVEWRAVRDRWLHRLKRMGFERLHWVVEWTRRRRPHLHVVLYLETGTATPDVLERIVGHWLAVTAAYRTLRRAQHVEPLGSWGGWSRYVAAHAGRSAKHYQRARNAMPDGWEGSGRMWGHRGEWPRVDPDKRELTLAEWWVLRRLIRGQQVAEARAVGRWRGVSASRRMLRCTDALVSPVRGFSLWSPTGGSATSAALVDAAQVVVLARDGPTRELGEAVRASMRETRRTLVLPAVLPDYLALDPVERFRRRAEELEAERA